MVPNVAADAEAKSSDLSITNEFQIQSQNQVLIWARERGRERAPPPQTCEAYKSQWVMCPSVSLFDSVIDAWHSALVSLREPYNPEILPGCPSSSLRKVYSIQNPRTQTLLPHKLETLPPFRQITFSILEEVTFVHSRLTSDRSDSLTYLNSSV